MREVDIGQPSAAQAKGETGKVWCWKDERVHSVMGLVQMHEGEYRQWHHAWGPVGWPRETQDWEKIVQPAVGGLDHDHALVKHHPLVVSPMTSVPPSDLQSARQMATSGVWHDDCEAVCGPAVGGRV